jgi:hypothetical protein
MTTMELAALFRIPPVMLGESPEQFEDQREHELVVCEMAGWPLTPGAQELRNERQLADLEAQCDSYARYMETRAIERATWPWWRDAIHRWTGR